MAPLPPFTGLVKVTFQQLLSGRSFGDSVYFLSNNGLPWSATELQDLAILAGTKYQASILTLQADNLFLNTVTALDLSDDVGRVGFADLGDHGTSGGTMTLPLNVVAHVFFAPPRRYRGGRPGYNVSGLDGSGLADSKSWTSAYATSIDTQVGLMISETVDAMAAVNACHQVVVSYHSSGALRPVPLVLAPISQEVQQRVCTLRRRVGKPLGEVV